MADAIQGIRSLPLHDLIGATLVAIVQADAQAAQATLEFIEAVGFITPKEGEGGENAGSTIAAGNLRMAEFKYKKQDANNEIADFVASVPVLSLVPIPSLQVKDAKFKFSAQITDISKESDKPAATPSAAPTALATTNIARTSIVSKLQPLKYELLAKPVAASGAKEQEVRGNFHLEVEISMGQADIPLGLEKLFMLMDQAIQDTQPSDNE